MPQRFLNVCKFFPSQSECQMFLLSFPLSPDFPGYFWLVSGLLHLWRPGLLRDQDVRMLLLSSSVRSVTCCLKLSHVGWVVFTRELFLSSTASGGSWRQAGGAFRDAWRFVMRGMMLLLAPPRPGTAESPEIITSDSDLAGYINDKFKFCKHFSKMIFCVPD